MSCGFTAGRVLTCAHVTFVQQLMTVTTTEGQTWLLLYNLIVSVVPPLPFNHTPKPLPVIPPTRAHARMHHLYVRLQCSGDVRKHYHFNSFRKVCV